MNKLMTFALGSFFAFTFAFAAAAADYVFPGWNCTDETKLTASVASAPNVYLKTRDNVLLAAAVTLDAKTVKTDLQKLNRKYSKNLLVDKTAWEPVIAQIRTTLENY